VRNSVCKECGQPLRLKYSLPEKLGKDLVSLFVLAFAGFCIGTYGIMKELWRIAPFAKSKGHKWLLQELSTLFFRLGNRAFAIATRLHEAVRKQKQV
jgi:hypothetical protein